MLRIQIDKQNRKFHFETRNIFFINFNNVFNFDFHGIEKKKKYIIFLFIELK